jgi:hypothetical protein
MSMHRIPTTNIHIGAKKSRYNASYMNSKIVLRLNTNPEQLARLERLQAAFAEVCTALGPIIRETRCWNRVALHHLTYRKLREQFPDLGSQMTCNAIYSVSRSARQIFQSKASPWNIEKRQDQVLPLLRFAATAPVYFDRHTLSLRRAGLSMFTLDGRLRFEVGLTPADELRFREERLKEIVLSRDDRGYFLIFSLGEPDEMAPENTDLPEYLIIIEPDVQAA